MRGAQSLVTFFRLSEALQPRQNLIKRVLLGTEVPASVCVLCHHPCLPSKTRRCTCALHSGVLWYSSKGICPSEGRNKASALSLRGAQLGKFCKFLGGSV